MKTSPRVNTPGFDDLSTDAVLRGIFGPLRRPATDSITTMLKGAHALYIWRGCIPHKIDGCTQIVDGFWMPGVMTRDSLEAAIARVQSRSRGKSRKQAIEAMRTVRKGLGARPITYHWSSFVECDCLSKADQAKKLRELEDSTGLKWGLQVDSGGKSIHAYLLYDSLIPAADPRWVQAQKLLQICCWGDTAICNPDRVMRAPGHMSGGGEKERDQPVILFTPSHRYQIDDVLRKLSAYAADLGCTDVRAAWDNLRLAARLESKGHPRAATYLREHLGSPAAAFMMMAHEKAGTPAAGGQAIYTGGSEWEQLSTGRNDLCPWCGSRGTRVTAVTRHEDGRMTARCFKEGRTRVQQVATDTDLPGGVEDAMGARKVLTFPAPVVEDIIEVEAPATEGEHLDACDVAFLYYIHLDMKAGRDLSMKAVQGDVLSEEEPRSNVTNLQHGRVVTSYEENNSDKSPVLHFPGFEPEQLRILKDESSGWSQGEVFCFNGVGSLKIHASGGTFARIPCDGWRCGRCGPRLALAVQAAVRIEVGRLASLGYHVGLMEDWHSSARGRWVARDRTGRDILGLHLSPGKRAYICAWRGPKALGPKGVESMSVAAAEHVASCIDLDAWGKEIGSIRILTGSRRIRHAVSLQARMALRIVSPNPQEKLGYEPDSEGPSLTMLTSPKETAATVVAKIEKFLQAGLTVSGAVSGRTRRVEFKVKEGEVPLAAAVRKMVATGKLHKLSRNRALPDLI